MVMTRYSENTLPLTDVLPLSLSLSLLFLPVAAISFNPLTRTPTPTLPYPYCYPARAGGEYVCSTNTLSL